MADDLKSKKWKIRDAEGNFFGPATMETLKKWARDGRLAADQSISDDDKTWRPVDSFPELGMDWAAELAPGKFFGPVHRDAMGEFIRSGDVSEDMAKFVRVRSMDEAPSALLAENAELRAKIDALRADFAERSAKLESEVEAAVAERRLAAGELSTRDLDFEAERQAFAAERSRMDAERQALAAEKSKLMAEIAKADKRAEVLAAQVAEAGSRSRSRESDIARIAELEKQVMETAAELKAVRGELDRQAADARRKLKEAEVAHLAEKKELETKLRGAKELADSVAAAKSRENSVKRLLSQINSILAAGGDTPAIVEADAVIIADGE